MQFRRTRDKRASSDKLWEDAIVSRGGILLGAIISALFGAAPAMAQAPRSDACAALGKSVTWPETGTKVATAAWHEASATAAGQPAHCEIVGVLHERVGTDGQHYAIRFHLRLPQAWNGRLFMQGGGGTDGDLGDALGASGGGDSALAQGFAVLSQDSGHANGVNDVADRGGGAAFGFDPQARADYGGTSLPPVVKAAKAAVRAFYGRAPHFSYFVGCSKGGQEGMMLASRYPALFDGIVASAPGFSLPRAAVAEMWDTQAFASVVKANGLPLTPANLAQSFSASDFALVRGAILAACDRDDGAADGIVGAFETCTSEKVIPQLAHVACAGAKQEGCLSAAQIEALRRVHDGARNGKGDRIYAGFYWDAGWGDRGWQMWKIGAGPVPPINVLMGAPALAAIFITPPTGLPASLQAKLDYAAAFDFDRDTPRIYATGHGFPRSAWEDIGARAANLDAFRKRGGKLIVSQGVSDPVFSLRDTVEWYAGLNGKQRADAYVRLFAVPGMGHCNGGPATDRYDAFAALVNWVEHGAAPDRIAAKAGTGTPWPGRSRPLCAYPATARYKGQGSLEDADNFVCG